MTVECQYLAQEFHHKFENFYLIITNIEHIEFEPWMTQKILDKVYISEIKDIFKAELDIGYAETKNGIVNISCFQHDTKFNYCGGNLLLKAEKIEIRDHLQRKLLPKDLYRASDNYWKNFDNK